MPGSCKVRILLAIFLTVSSAPSLRAQKGENPPHMTLIRGVIRDAETHAPLAHVVVTLDREDSGYVNQTESDEGGKFTFPAPGQQLFIVRAKPIGYSEISKSVDLRTAGTDYVTLDAVREVKSGPLPAGEAVNARDAAVPANARKEFLKGRQVYLEKKDLEGSAEHLRKAIKNYPQYTDAYVLLGMVYTESGKLDDARTTLEQAVKSDPTSPTAHVTLGMLLNHEKDYAGAEKSLTRGLELDPQAPQAHYELAKTLWALGRWQEAEPHVQKALTTLRDMAPAHVLMGNIALRKRDPVLALKEYKEYLRLDPKGPMAAGAQQMIDKLEKSPSTPQ